MACSLLLVALSRKSMNFKAFLPFTLVASLIFSACSSGPETDESAEAAAEVVPDEPHDVELVVSGMDNMMFDTNKLQAMEGQRVKLVFKNVGSIPKAAMGHNWVLLAPGTDLPKFAVDAGTFLTNEYIPNSGAAASSVLAHTKLLGPKEQDVIYFTAGAPGEYPFVCTFPGHAAVMQGVLTVAPGAAEKMN